MNPKKETLVNNILEACEEKTKEPLTEKEKAVLTRFLKNRLRLHGEDYIFYTVYDHHRKYLDLKTPWTLEVVAEYALKFSK